jgi:DNA-binding transcriptional MerR regulator
MLINEVEKRLGMTKNNIRFYEKVGLISPGRNIENGYRDYKESDVDRLSKVMVLRSLNLSIDKIKGILDSEKDFKELLEHHVSELENSVDYNTHVLSVCNDFIRSEGATLREFVNSYSNDIYNQDKHFHQSDMDLLSFLPDEIKLKYLESHLLNNSDDVLDVMVDYMDNHIKVCLSHEKTIKHMIDSADSVHKRKMIDALQSYDKELYHKLKCHVYDLEDILKLSKDVVVKALDGFSRAEILMAMKASSPSLKEFISELLNDQHLVNDTEELGPIKLRDVTEVHDKILKAVNNRMNQLS